MYKLLLVAIATLSLLITGCSSGGGGVTNYSGSTNEATIDATNAEDLAKANIDATLKANSFDNAPSYLKSNSKLVELSSKTSDAILNETIPGFCDSGDVDVSGSETSATITYNSCTVVGITVDGRATFERASDGSFTIKYTNYSITIDDQVTSIENLTVSCSSAFDCTTTSDFTASDGNIYRVENFEVFGNETFGFTVSGRIYHPDAGFVDITTNTPVTFGSCANENIPDGGEIQFTTSNGSATITYSCTEITISIAGGSTTTVAW